MTEKKTEKTTESPKDRFRRLAAARVSRALKTTALVGNLFGSGYESTDEERTKVIAALKGAVADLEAKAANRGRKAAAAAFSL